MSSLDTPNQDIKDILKKFRFEKKLNLLGDGNKLEVKDQQTGEGALQNGSCFLDKGPCALIISNGVSPILRAPKPGGLSSITISNMKRRVNRILSDSETDTDENQPKPVSNGIIDDDEETESKSLESKKKEVSQGISTKVNDKGCDSESNETSTSKDGLAAEKTVVQESGTEKPTGVKPPSKGVRKKKNDFRRLKQCDDSPDTDSSDLLDANGDVITGAQTKEEKALKSVIAECPGYDPIDLQDQLLRNDWNVEATVKSIKSKKKNFKELNGKKRRVIESDTEESCDDDDTEVKGSKLKKRKVYDSDAESSDEEITDELDGDKGDVFEFFNSGKMGELQLMSGCSKKKAELIASLRPFHNWSDLHNKLEATSSLSADLLNAAQGVLSTRKEVQSLIEKCLQLSRKLEKAIASGLSNSREQPEILSKELSLSDYQLVGLNWLMVMHANRVNAILADEMGLGKTIQIISFLARLKETNISQPGCPHLVVVPAATLENWNNEIVRWCPSMNVLIYHGSQEDRRCQRYEWIREGFGDVDIILSTYNIVGSTPEERKLFKEMKLHYAVFDEAHMLKNMNTLRYKNLMKINAQNRILLTGTPVQNNLLELMSLLVFVMPQMFGKKKDSLEALFSKCVRTSNEGGDDLPEFERKQIALAKEIMKPFVLRRLKVDVLKDLPTKTASIKICPLLEDQEQKYKELIADLAEQAGAELEEDEIRDSGMAMYMKLRRLANHPLLLRYLYDEEDILRIAKALSTDCMYKDTVVEYIVDDLRFMSDFAIHQLTREYKSCTGWGLKPENIVKSGKLVELDQLLPELKNEGHRVLLFSQFVIVLDILEEYLKIRGHKYLRLDGSTPVVIRQDLIDEYNGDPSIFVFMLTTRAGGLGINLTSADTVIIHDVDVNPHNDRQAEDRAHRIGQKRPVTVIRLISKGTIEENILALSNDKLKLEKEMSSTEENESSEKKCMASLLRQVLGLDKGSSSKSSAVKTSPTS